MDNLDTAEDCNPDLEIVDKLIEVVPGNHHIRFDLKNVTFIFQKKILFLFFEL